MKVNFTQASVQPETRPTLAASSGPSVLRRLAHPRIGRQRVALARASHLAHHRYAKSRLAALWYGFGPGVGRSGGRNGQKASRAPVPSHRGSRIARTSIASQSSATVDDAQPFHRADSFRPTASSCRSCQTLGVRSERIALQVALGPHAVARSVCAPRLSWEYLAS